MDLNGTSYNALKPAPTKWTPYAFDGTDIKGKELGGYASDYVLNTVFEAGFTTGNELDITAILEKYLNLTVTTDEVGIVIPGLLAKYGSGKNVSISGKYIEKQSELHITKDKGTAVDLSLLIDISVGGENAIHASLPHSMVQALLNSKNSLLTGKVSNFKLGTCGADSKSSFSTCVDIVKGIQTLVDTNVVAWNALLAKGITIPSIFGLDVNDLDIINYDGYLFFGITVKPSFAA